MGTDDTDKIAILESTHTFPCVYQFRVIGDNNPLFVARILQAVVVVAGCKQQPKVDTRESAGGKHTALHIHVDVPDAHTVLKLYTILGKMEGVRYLL